MPKPLCLVRLATQPTDDSRAYHLREFAGDALEEAVAKAMAWNADRSNHGGQPARDVIVQQWDPQVRGWTQLDWWQMMSGA
jgi:hypothetical protein